MGMKPRKPRQRAVWLSRDRDDADFCRLFYGEPFFNEQVGWWLGPVERPGTPYSFDLCQRGVIPSDVLDTEVPTDRPVRVRLRVEVVD